MSWDLCMCECHSVIPVHIKDRVHAASACSKCHDFHVQKYVKEPVVPLRPPRPADACGDPNTYDEPNYRDKKEDGEVGG